MIGMAAIKRIERVNAELAKIGFKMEKSKISSYSIGDAIALVPLDDQLPIYARDAELFIGDLTAVENFVLGFQQARKYDSLIFGKKHETNRSRKEQDYRNQELLNKLKNSEESQGFLD